MIFSKSSPRWSNLGASLILASRSTDTILNPLRIGTIPVVSVIQDFEFQNLKFIQSTEFPPKSPILFSL
uniref:Uncharacterized protein n=1 Tax=Solanum tuberosum TaxID=4113 RepID=M1BA69_SOLTU